jgi:triacylglycerol lipase
MNLVFASGFLVPQQFLGLNYFRDVKAHLTQQGHRVLTATVPPVATSEERAKVPAAAIQQEFPAGPIHIIAHSMGGLDSRTIIGRNLLGLADPGRIASLTTLSTPHRGSPVADLLAGPQPDDARRVVYDVISGVIAKLGVPTGALANLTAEAASRVPDPVAAGTHPHIRFRSYFASGRPGLLSTAFLLAPTHHYIHTVTGQDNDGVVALDSARYGELQQPFWECDHVDMLGYNLDTAGVGPPIFPHLARIDAIIAELGK